MITSFNEYITESKFTDTIKKIIEYPVVKFIENKVKGLSDDEKLLKIAKIARNIDKIFCASFSWYYYTIFFMASLIGTQIPHFINKVPQTNATTKIFIVSCIYLFGFYCYITLTKKYRMLAKDYYRKIRAAYVNSKKINKINDDPYGEENWGDELEIVAKANKIRYHRGKLLGGANEFWEEYMPFFGVGKDKADVRPD